MRPKKPVHVYKENQYLGHFESLADASRYTKDTPNAILDVIQGKRKLTRKGYHYNQTKLTEEEINNIQTVNNEQLTFQARNKEQRIKDFKYFLYRKLDKRWQTIPKQMANLEKQYIQEFLDTI